MGVKQILLMLAAVALVGCGTKDDGVAEGGTTEPKDIIDDLTIIEAAIRENLKKPTGELTKADLEKVTFLDFSFNQHQLTDVKGLENLNQLWQLHLSNNQLTDVQGLEKLTQLRLLDLSRNQLTDVKGLEKLTQLETLYLEDNPDLTKTQIDELQKALPKCLIISNPTK